MSVHVFEVVKEFRFDIEGFKDDVIGQILRSTDPRSKRPFSWYISHHYKPTASALSIYFPSALSSDSEAEVEPLLLSYAAGFTAEFGVVKS